MSMLDVLLGRADPPLTAQSPSTASSAPPAQSGRLSFADLGAQLGSDLEIVRNLLLHAESKINELDEVKRAFAGIVAPVSATILALETEKSLAFSLNESLNESRDAHQALLQEAHQLRQMNAELEFDRDELRRELALTQQANDQLERERSEVASAAAAQLAHIKDVEQQLAHSIEAAGLAHEESQALRRSLQTAHDLSATLEAALAAVNERLTLSEDERRSLQASIEQHVGEGSRLSRRLSETTDALHSAGERIAEMETKLAVVQEQAATLRVTLDETRERYRTETTLLNARHDSIQSRADIAERLLGEARKSISSLLEEVRVYERKTAQAVAAGQAAEAGQVQMRAAEESYERQLRDMGQSHSALTERFEALTKKLNARENQLAQANGKADAMADRMKALEAQLQANRSAYEERIDALSAELHRERMDKAMLQGALESARKEQTRLRDGAIVPPQSGELPVLRTDRSRVSLNTLARSVGAKTTAA
jgi:crescentin